MKKISIALMSILLVMSVTLKAQNEISKEERAFAVKHLNDTEDYMLKTLKGLSE